MPISIVVGGQFGSEGKGKVSAFFSKELNATFAIRCGGPNSGHVVINEDGNKCVFRQLPTATIYHSNLGICAGSYIDLEILMSEINIYNVSKERLFIDENAIIITDEHKRLELGLKDNIGSTGSGTGKCLSSRINREHILFAKDVEILRPYICDLSFILRQELNLKNRILIEGTQGFGLSNIHSSFYPYVTSRDTTAAGFLSEVGLSPLDVDDVILVFRTFPIRVSGNSGPLKNEISWELLSKEIGRKTEERTTVTNKIRRIARFDLDLVVKAINNNNPTKIVLNHCDYLSKENLEILVKEMKHNCGIKIDYYGFGPSLLIKCNII